MSETVEANQCVLEGVGTILYPGVLPPGRIDDVTFITEDCRVFKEPNTGGKIYYYKRNEPQKCWFLNQAPR